MDLTIIIVNYNVKFFLEQCLHSVKNAIKNINAEIIVVDNNSADGSCSMIKEKYPEVKIIENQVNAGFSKANNQALRIAAGRYCLLLNPDTMVEESTFVRCIRFMDEHPDAGALGVKMIDGKGNFLPESKRSLPTPDVAFFKIFGLSKLFPRSRKFGMYHLGHLDKDKTHEIEVVSGAFMFINKKALDKTGLLDEDFFMYGEDIDISYRLKKAGFKNYYFPETTIIHYKGESTKKGSINYVIVFYRAMIIFANKHYSRKNIRSFTILLTLAIYFRASLSILKRFLISIYQPVIDALLIYAGFMLLSPMWEKLRFGLTEYFPEEYFMYFIPGYIAILLLSIYYSGGYEKPIRVWNLIRGYLTGVVVLLVIYALLPEDMRFSRVMILMGTLWGIPVILLHRIIPAIFKCRDYELVAQKTKNIVIAGQKEEAVRVSSIIQLTSPDSEILGFVKPTRTPGVDSTFIGTVDQLRDIVLINTIDEIIFCAGDIQSKDIIRYMSSLSGLKVDFRIAPPESISIIGSKSIETSGDMFLMTFDSISKEASKRNKRLFDIVASILLLILSPVFSLIFRNFKIIFPGILKVLSGTYTWVGYCRFSDLSSLPAIKNAVFTLSSGLNNNPDRIKSEQLNIMYARDYSVARDFQVLWRNLVKTVH